ncbi:DUF4817 domain-containing protein [Trichonephila clavipes]|uniref:DUF4817 domain-containing protein n=1 Tax=Trichonephila clavipes TaxID=2585209 RepID=A0A8X6RNP9_TRICX|nr:DUF4817 domain-containing protein [Trichonephila clavipes]
MATSTNKTAAFGVKLIHKCMSKPRYTRLFGALYGLVESFFKNDEGHNVTVNGDRYRAMITNFFIPELNNHDVQELWFQQDGATCHTARATIDLLKDTFGDRLISRFGPVNWPPRSCDLTPLDYFLWGYVKSLVYSDKPQTFYHLEDNIRYVIAVIRPQMLEKVIQNWTSRFRSGPIRVSRGSHMPEIIFKIAEETTYYIDAREVAPGEATEDMFHGNASLARMGRYHVFAALHFTKEQTLWGGRGYHKDSDLHNSPWSETSSFGSRSVKPCYEHIAGRYVPDLWIGRRKYTNSGKIVSRKVPTKRCTGPSDASNLHHNCLSKTQVHICQLGVRNTVPYSSTGDDSSNDCDNAGLFPPMLL